MTERRRSRATDRTAAERAEQKRHKVRVRERQRRDHLSAMVGVLDEVAGRPGQIRPRCLDEVAAFFQVNPWVVTNTVRRHAEEFRSDGWRPHGDAGGRDDLWTDQAVVRAGLLIPESEVAAHLRHLLGIEQMPLMYSTSRERQNECRQLYEKALGVVADVHECMPDDLWRTMQSTDRYELMSMVVALASVTPYNQPGIGQWLQNLGNMSGNDGCISRGLAMLIPQRQRADEYQLPEAGSAANEASCGDGAARSALSQAR